MKRAILIGVLLALFGCAHVLEETKFITDRFQRAEVSCKAAPQGKLGTKQENDRITLCTKAETCIDTSKAALQALKESQSAIASGSADVGLEVKSAVTSRIANVACKGW